MFSTPVRKGAGGGRAINSADERNSPETGITVRELKNAPPFLIPGTEDTSGHDTVLTTAPAKARTHKSSLLSMACTMSARHPGPDFYPKILFTRDSSFSTRPWFILVWP